MLCFLFHKTEQLGALRSALVLISASQEDAMVSDQVQRGDGPAYDSRRVAAVQQDDMLSGQGQVGQKAAYDYQSVANHSKLSAAKGKWATDDSSDSSSSDSDDEPVDPSVRLARRLEEADRRGLHSSIYERLPHMKNR